MSEMTEPLVIAGYAGLTLWGIVFLGFFVEQVGRKYYLKRTIDREWIKSWEQESGKTIEAMVVFLEKSLKPFEKLQKILFILLIFSSVSDIVFYLQHPNSLAWLTIFLFLIVVGFLLPSYCGLMIFPRYLKARRDRIKELIMS